MKDFYFLVDGNNVIRDAIDYEVEGYTLVQLNQTHLPAGVNGGWYKLEGGALVEYPELKPANLPAELVTAQARIVELEANRVQTNLSIIEIWENIIPLLP